ncbi:MAG: winged helix-turn-helix transcriptional regulator, partial [Chloroflexales bacterium]|nr:winged helix-turn-helix transcriptional regulator [Chloroflexales bacterium]
LSGRGEPLVLVLEDYHALDAPAVDAALSWLLAHQPPALRLLITSREDPPLPLARLRARGQLSELRGADLRFSIAEASALIQHLTGRPLSDPQAEALVARTEGWAAGLQLASLALRESADVDSLIASLRGTHRLIIDYLTDEVLLAQPPEIQQFLLHTAILDRLCGELCDALLKDEDRAASKDCAEPLILHPSSFILAQLERANLFLVPLDAERRWYRYHALFADLLRARLAATAGDAIAALHRRAARWYAAAIPAHGEAMLALAMHHALEGGDDERAAQLIEDHGASLNGRGEQARMARWLARLPPELFARRPQLCLRDAWLRTLTGQHGAAEARLRDAERALGALPAASEQADLAAWIGGNVAAISAYLTYARGDAAATVAHGQAALSQLPISSTVVRTATHVMVGAGALDSDQSALAEQQLRQAIACGQTGGNPYAALTAQGMLGTLLLRQGRLDVAERQLRAALEPHRDPGGAPLPIAGDLCVQLGHLRHERDDLAGAAALLAQGRRCGELVANGWTVQRASLSLAWTRFVQGDTAAADALLDALEALAPRLAPIIDRSLIGALRARIQLADGDRPAVQAWLDAEEPRPGGAYRIAHLPIALMRARALTALGRAEEAVTLLDPPLAAAETAGRVGHQIQLQVARALALQACGDQEQAAERLRRALEQGAALGHARSFLDEGPGVATLLGRMKDEGGRMKPYIARLLSAFPGTAAMAVGSELHPSPFTRHPLPEPLMPREVELLQLIDAGLSNQAIAERLMITVGTVKWHLNRLYAKLDVRGRTQALARARALGVLP